MPKARRSLAVVVSICAPAPAITFSPMLRVRRSSTVLTRCRKPRPRRSNSQRMSVLPGGFALAGGKARTVVLPSGREILVGTSATDARGKQCVQLRGHGLRANGL